MQCLPLQKGHQRLSPPCRCAVGLGEKQSLLQRRLFVADIMKACDSCSLFDRNTPVCVSAFLQPRAITRAQECLFILEVKLALSSASAVVTPPTAHPHTMF